MAAQLWPQEVELDALEARIREAKSKVVQLDERHCHLLAVLASNPSPAVEHEIERIRKETMFLRLDIERYQEAKKTREEERKRLVQRRDEEEGSSDQPVHCRRELVPTAGNTTSSSRRLYPSLESITTVVAARARNVPFVGAIVESIGSGLGIGVRAVIETGIGVASNLYGRMFRLTPPKTIRD